MKLAGNAIAVVAFALALTGGPASANDKHCTGSLTGHTNDNVVVSGPCSILRPATVDGNIYVLESGELTLTGKVNGNIEATGNGIVMLGPKALVRSDVTHNGNGTVDFTSSETKGAKVRGNVELSGTSMLVASGTSEKNRVKGSIVCTDSATVSSPGLPDLPSETDFDGDGDDDGTIDGDNKC